MSLVSLLFGLGVAHLAIVGTGVAAFLALVGVCCPKWDEPYPRVTQLAYPSEEEKHWWFMHVSKTALRKDWYVTSISQFVGARGTTGAKLMGLMTTSISVSAAFIHAALYCNGSISVAGLVLAIIGSFGLLLLGFVESSLDWTLPVDWPDLENPADEKKMEEYYKSMQVQRIESDEDSAIKSKFASLHMISAFMFIGFEFAAQMLVAQTTASIIAYFGLGFFWLFCVLQWITGANDVMLLANPRLTQFAVVNWPAKLQVFYFPQGKVSSERTQKALSMMFIFIELLGFGLIASSSGWAAITSLP